MDNQSQTSMRNDLADQAAVCRMQADHFSDPERELLLKMANSFDQIASGDQVRTAIEASRCW